MTIRAGNPKEKQPVVIADTINMSHGSGGKAMRELIDEIFVQTFDNDLLSELEDQATIDLSQFYKSGDKLAFTTDSYVVDPIFFPGGDIGKLAINGTVNDLAVGGAKPLYLTCALIIEEGFPVKDLRTIIRSMKEAGDLCGIQVVAGDTKVVGRGQADKLFINTSGVGIISNGVKLGAFQAEPGDAIIINGTIGDHGAAIVGCRQDLALENNIQSDCQPLNGLIESILNTGKKIRCMRDATRGGVATVLNEFAQSGGYGIRIHESKVPIHSEVRGICEILGFDPLFLANEGKLVAIVRGEDAQDVLACMLEHPGGKGSAIIGEVIEQPKGKVVMATTFGGERILDLLLTDQLPRIC